MSAVQSLRIRNKPIAAFHGILAEHHFRTRQEVEHTFERLPFRFKPKFAARYVEKAAQSFKLANIDLVQQVEWMESLGINIDIAASEQMLRDAAEAGASRCRAIGKGFSKWSELARMRKAAKEAGVMPPDAREFSYRGQVGRLKDAQWWRRALRRAAAQQIEGAAIGLGFVHNRAEIYASNETVERREGQKQRNRAMLEAVLAVNNEGQEYTLAELSDLGVSNPKIRRMELMTRLAGFDACAQLMGHAGEFYTLTAPSKYHKIDSKTGKENPTYNGALPNDTQKYLCRVWARTRAKLARLGIHVYGFRVAEPHHDGTPHWHILIFMAPEHVEDVRAVMRHYALQEDGDERGAAEHRFKYEALDRSKGSACSYLAKYIAKNIDGYGGGDDYEGGDIYDNAKRVDAWAASWKIRQFQQIGGAPVTAWRELRRLKPEDAGEDLYMRAFIEAADRGDWQAYVNLQGGPFVSRRDLQVRLWRAEALDTDTGEIRGAAHLNKYGEPIEAALLGLDFAGVAVETRRYTWTMVRKGAGNGSAGHGVLGHLGAGGGLDAVESDAFVRSGAGSGGVGAVLDFSRNGSAVSPWSSVNNCTEDLPRWSVMPPAWWESVNINDERGLDGYVRNEKNRQIEIIGGGGGVGGDISQGGSWAKGANRGNGVRPRGRETPYVN